MIIKRFATLALTIGAFVLVGLTTASSQSYPSRPITLIVPYSPGGPTDSLARILIDHMRLSLGQSIVIENVTGAGGSIGVGRVARAIPDGYTFGIGQVSSNGFNGAVYKLSYDLLEDFAPIALLTTAPMWLLGRGTLPPNNIKELITWLRVKWRHRHSCRGRDGQRVTSLRALLPEPHRNSVFVRAVSWRRASQPRLDRGAD